MEPQVGVKSQYTIDTQKVSDRSTMGVNVANGNFVMQSQDLQVAGLGLGLNASRAYNSMADANQDSGFGELAAGHWLGVGEFQLVAQEDNSMTFYDRSGAAWHFSGNSCNYTPPPGLQATLACQAGGGWILTFLQTGEELYFGDYSYAAVEKDVDRYGNTITYTYSDSPGWNSGELTSITDTQGRTYSVHHSTIDDNDVVDYIKDNTDGRQWSYGYNANNALLTSVTDPDGNVVHYDYTSADQNNLYDIDKITDGRGHIIDITYDSNERVTGIVRETSGASSSWPTTSYDYETPDATHCGDGSSVYTGVVYQTRVTDPNGQNTYYCADQSDRVTHTYDPNGNRWAQAYNSRNNIATFNAAGTGSPLTTAVYEQDATGSGSCGQGSGYSWDNLCSITAPQGEETTMSYTHTGWTGDTDIRNFLPTSISDPQAQGASGGKGQPLSLSWDATGNLTDISQYTNSAHTSLVHATLAYNSDGTVKTATDANGNVTTYDEYPSTGPNDRQGLLKDIVSPTVSSGTRLGTSTGHYMAQYNYDSAGRPDSITNGRGQTTTLAYDGEDRVAKITFSDGSCFRYTYDANGNLTGRDEYSSCTGAVTNAYGYAYDELNRRTSETQPGSVTHTYGYDKSGNMTSLTDASGTTNYDYNADNTLKDVAEPGGSCSGTVSLCTTFAYDVRGNRTETDTPNGIKLKDSYDSSDKLLSARAYNSSGTELRGFSYGYRLSGKTADLELAATRTNDSTGDVTSYGYDGLDRLTDATTKTSGGSTLSDYSYVLDGDGNITHKTVVSGATTNTYYGYNGDNLLCWSATTSASGCSPAPTGAKTYSYDADGNDQRFSYNNRNQTTSAFSQSLGYAGPNQFELITAGATSLANDLLGIASTKTGTSTTSYTRDPSGTLIARKLPTGAHEYYEHLDNLGSITGIDNSSGASVETKAYDPYGNLTTNTSTTQADPFGYAAGYTNPYGSTIHYGLRWYDPSIQRWSQPDQLNLPADLEQGDKFLYAAGDPLNWLDITGLMPTDNYYVPFSWSRYRRYIRSTSGLGWVGAVGRAIGGVGRFYYHVLAGCANPLSGTPCNSHNDTPAPDPFDPFYP